MMQEYYLLIKTIHIISSTILFGTGIGTAFGMFYANRYGDVHAKANAATTTVLADFLFTTPAIIIQPLSGLALVSIAGYNYLETWLIVTYILYFIAFLCWAPVVWIQIQLKKLAINAVLSNSQLPENYYRLFLTWFILGWPAFIALVAIFFLMIYKPDL